MTDLDPRLQFLIDYEISKLDWMDQGPRKTQAEHMAKVRILSMPWQEMLDLYAKTKWEENHGRIRVIQYVETHEDTGAPVLTRWIMEQNIDGEWTKVPVIYVNEDEGER